MSDTNGMEGTYLHSWAIKNTFNHQQENLGTKSDISGTLLIIVCCTLDEFLSDVEVDMHSMID